MKIVDNVKLKIGYEISVDGKVASRSKTFANIDVNATDDNLKTCGETMGTFMEGNNKVVYRVEEAELA